MTRKGGYVTFFPGKKVTKERGRELEILFSRGKKAITLLSPKESDPGAE